jgi:uncharacterized protein YukE
MAIKFDYNQTIAQAKLLDELANDMQNQCCKKMSEVCENIDAAWSGQAANTYKKYVGGVRDDLLKKAKYLRDIAEFLRSSAKKMQAADAPPADGTNDLRGNDDGTEYRQSAKNKECLIRARKDLHHHDHQQKEAGRGGSAACQGLEGRGRAGLPEGLPGKSQGLCPLGRGDPRLFSHADRQRNQLQQSGYGRRRRN